MKNNKQTSDATHGIPQRNVLSTVPLTFFIWGMLENTVIKNFKGAKISQILDHSNGINSFCRNLQHKLNTVEP